MVDRSLLGVINVIWLGLSRLLCGSLPRSQTLLSPWFYLWCRKTWLDDVLLLFVKIPVWISSSLRLKSDFREEHITELSSPTKIDLRLNAIFSKTNIVEFVVNLLNLLFVLTQEATLSKLLLPKAILFWRYTGKKYIAALLTYQQRYKIFDMLIQMTWTGLDINDLY